MERGYNEKILRARDIREMISLREKTSKCLSEN